MLDSELRLNLGVKLGLGLELEDAFGVKHPKTLMT